MGIRLIVSDIDGTLIGKDQVILNGFEDLAELIQKHHLQFTLASGRTPSMMAEFIERLHIDLPTIVCNGSAGYYEGKYIWDDVLNPEKIRKVIEFADSMGMAVIISDGYYEKAYRLNPYIQQQIETFGKWDKIYCPEGDSEWAEVKIQKLLIIDPENPGRIDTVIDKVDMEQDAVNIVRYDDRGIEIMPVNSSKGNGLKRLAKFLGIELEDILAVGDNLNDIDMLEAAGTGVAVHNAAEELKSHANYICQDDTVLGVIEAIKKFCISDS